MTSWRQPPTDGTGHDGKCTWCGRLVAAAGHDARCYVPAFLAQLAARDLAEAARLAATRENGARSAATGPLGQQTGPGA